MIYKSIMHLHSAAKWTWNLHAACRTMRNLWNSTRCPPNTHHHQCLFRTSIRTLFEFENRSRRVYSVTQMHCCPCESANNWLLLTVGLKSVSIVEKHLRTVNQNGPTFWCRTSAGNNSNYLCHNSWQRNKLSKCVWRWRKKLLTEVSNTHRIFGWHLKLEVRQRPRFYITFRRTWTVLAARGGRQWNWSTLHRTMR